MECLYKKHLDESHWLLVKLFLGVLHCNVQQGAGEYGSLSNLMPYIDTFLREPICVLGKNFQLLKKAFHLSIQEKNSIISQRKFL